MARGQEPTTVPPDKVDAYDRLIATLPGIERKGATLPYTSVNGHMFSFLTPVGTLALRLSRADREAFIEQHATRLHEAHGTVMKEYVTVPEALLTDTESLSRDFAASYAYVASLKPKPTRR
jgi:TfoX/Sxy family transcriptional regulator of competence genes